MPPVGSLEQVWRGRGASSVSPGLAMPSKSRWQLLGDFPKQWSSPPPHPQAWSRSLPVASPTPPPAPPLPQSYSMTQGSSVCASRGLCPPPRPPHLSQRPVSHLRHLGSGSRGHLAEQLLGLSPEEETPSCTLLRDSYKQQNPESTKRLDAVMPGRLHTPRWPGTCHHRFGAQPATVPKRPGDTGLPFEDRIP